MLDVQNKETLETLKKLYEDSLTYQNKFLTKIIVLEQDKEQLKAVYDLEHDALNRVSGFNEYNKQKLEKIKKIVDYYDVPNQTAYLLIRSKIKEIFNAE